MSDPQHQWGKALSAGVLSGAMTIATVGWVARGYIEDLRILIVGLQGEIKTLQEAQKAGHQALECCIDTRRLADNTSAKLDGHLRPDPVIRPK